MLVSSGAARPKPVPAPKIALPAKPDLTIKTKPHRGSEKSPAPAE